MIRPRALLGLSVLILAACAEAPPAPVIPPPPMTAPPAPPSATIVTAAPGYPAAAKKPVEGDFFGTKVSDPYQWLEKSSDPDVQKWTAAETQYARGALDALPARAAIKERIASLRKGGSIDFVYLVRRGDAQFAWKIEPPKEQPVLVTLGSVGDPASAKVVLDPNAVDKTGKTTMDFYVPSRDGKLVAVSLSKGGSESGDVHVYEAATGKELSDVIPRVNGGTAGGSVAWTADGKGFFYTRYPHAGERSAEDMSFYQQVYFHEIGKPAETDHYAVGKEFPRIAEVVLASSDDGKWTLAQVANGDGGEFEHWLYDGKGWKKFAQLSDKVTDALFGRDGRIYLLSKNGAPRGKILRLSPAKPDLASAEVVVPESDATIQFFSINASRLYVVDLLGGPSRIRAFDLKGKALADVPIPRLATVGQIARIKGDEVLIRYETFVDPPAWYRFGGSGEVQKTKLFTTSPADFKGIEAVRETCKSKDGTDVPISVLHRKGLGLDKKNPALLNGYGGFDVSEQPFFAPQLLAWLEQGGVYASANLRGGGEFGEAWHEAGRLLKKQNVFDDFAACAQHLADAGYTSPEKLAIQGGSNGGLLMGAMITQHPELFRAAFSAVGIYDMLRMELWPNGAFNIPEYGSVKDPDQFKAMFAYSPYHHVRDGFAYPSVLFTTGENDPRVDPGQSRKMAARLQAATSSKNPVLLLTKTGAGHGIGGALSDRIEEEADVYAFLFHELGVEYKPAAAGK
jgi:prolyl oligopeptidase